MQVLTKYNNYTSPNFKANMSIEYRKYMPILQKFVNEGRTNDYIAEALGKSPEWVEHELDRLKSLSHKVRIKSWVDRDETILKMKDASASEMEIARKLKISYRIVRRTIKQADTVLQVGDIQRKKNNDILAMFDLGVSVTDICAKFGETRNNILKLLSKKRKDYNDTLVYLGELKDMAISRVANQLKIDEADLKKYLK